MNGKTSTTLSRLHFQKMGNGPKMLLAFHGFAQESSFIKPLAEVVQEEYTIFSFDLFYHGQSRLRKPDVPLNKQRLAQLVSEILEREKVSSFSVLGFSMGGKFALTVLEAFADQIEEVFLIAPDGISTSFWYNIATYPSFLRQLFRRTVVQPKPFLRLVDFLHKRRLLAPGLARFAQWHMDTLTKRLRVYRSWTAFRELSFDLRDLVKLINQQQIKVKLFLGSHDQVIAPKRIRSFMKALSNGELIVLKSGHTFLINEVANYLRDKRSIANG